VKSAARVKADRLAVAAKVVNVVGVLWIGALMAAVGLAGKPGWMLTLALPTVLGSVGLQALVLRAEAQADEDDGWLQRSAEWGQS
jgi:hypothetical protein